MSRIMKGTLSGQVIRLYKVEDSQPHREQDVSHNQSDYKRITVHTHTDYIQYFTVRLSVSTSFTLPSYFIHFCWSDRDHRCIPAYLCRRRCNDDLFNNSGQASIFYFIELINVIHCTNTCVPLDNPDF